nr:IPT/TIG domain-containing protein [Granulicella aggregans]
MQIGCAGAGSGSGGGGQSQPDNPVPAVTGITPASVTAGAAPQTITVSGSGFVAASVINFNGAALSTTYTSATSLQAQVPASALTAGGDVSVTVSNPTPGGGSSPASTFAVMSPTPSVSSISPAYIPQGLAVTLTISGSGFESNSVVKWNGSARPTTFFSTNTLTVALTAADVPSAGNGQIAVSNPGPGGSDTQAATEPVYAVPAIASLSPSSASAGASGATVTVTGTSFSSDSVVKLDGTAVPTAYGSATTLTAQISAAALANARPASITVQNPTPVPVLSPSVAFPVNSPTPVLTTVYPTGLVQGAAATAITLTGTGFIANSSISWNGTALPTVYFSPTALGTTVPATDLATAGAGQIAVSNPAPNAATSSTLSLPVLAPPAISSVNPGYVQVPTSGATTSTNITITGTNFAANATVAFNGYTLPVVSQTSTQIVATVSSQTLYQTGAVQIYVTNPAPSAGGISITSQPASINVISPSASFNLNPSSAVLGSPDLKITLSGSGFFADSVVQWNGAPLVTTYVSSNTLTAVVPAGDLAVAGDATLSVATPENMGIASTTAAFNTYIALPINGLVYNAKDSLLYATIAGSGGPGLGNSLVGVDPVTGAIQRTIFVGSEPTRVVLSTDGTQAFVGLNGAGAVRQVDLTSGVAGVQFTLGGSQGVYDPPFTAAGLAALPGQPNSVAVYGSNGVVTIFDSGIARPKTSSGLSTYFYSNSGSMTFGASASTLYLAASTVSSYLYQLTIDSTGVTGFQQLSSSAAGATIQYDNGRLYTPNGLVTDPATGATLGQFSTASPYSTGTVAASGPIYSDSSLNRAWIVVNNFGSASTQLIGYDETSFLPVTSIGLNGIGAVANSNYSSSNPADLVRWGQDGLAFHTGTQLFLLHGSTVKDTSTTPADLQVTTQLPATVTTGTAFTYQVQVKNLGSSDASGVVLATSMPSTLLYGSASVTQGTCNGGGVLYCNLGSLANGATATLTVTATPSTAGTVQVSATVDSQTYDPVASNNIVVSTTTAGGSLYAPVPTVSSLSPNALATGTASATLTVNGAGFNSGSVVNWNGTALTTSFVSATQLTATVDSSLLTQIGWAAVSVTNPSPGGGASSNLTVSVYSLLSVPANAMVYDPYSRKLFTVLPSTSTSPAGNSLVSIDPVTGTVGTPITVGSEPNTIAESPGGKYFYIGLSGAESLARFNVASQAVDTTIPLVSPGYFSGPVAATALASIPGLENSVSVDNVGILDFSGTSATLRPNSALGYNDAVFPDSGHAYTYDNQSTGAEIYRYTVDATGVHNVDGSTLLGTGGFSGSLALDQGLLFASGGGIIDPTTTPLTQLGVLPLGPGPYGYGLGGAGALPYQTTKKSFVFGINSAGTWAVVMERFDTQHFILEDSVTLPTNYNIIESVPATRWGQDGIALLLTGGIGSSSPSQVMLMRGAFVLPAEASANGAPTLTSAGSGTLTSGSGNQILTVVGTGFIPGASVLWNGVAYTTTFVDTQHLTVAVGAADVSTPGTVSITCQNPGSSASNAVTLTVN